MVAPFFILSFGRHTPAYLVSFSPAFYLYVLMEPRDKRDLPEVVAEILIEQHATREEIVAMRQEMREGNAALRQEMREGNAALRQEMREGNTALRQEIYDSNTALRQEIQGSNAALRQEIQDSGVALRQQLQTSHEGLVQLFNGMTNAILDAINRGTDRYNSTADEVDRLKTRVTRLEGPA